MTVTANCKKAGGISSCLIIVKQTFRALAEQSGDERLLSALDPSNPSAERIMESDRLHRETLEQVASILLDKGVEARCIKRAPGEHFEVKEDLVITVGGDGTFLDASHSILTDVPVLGVNSAPISSFGNFCRVNRTSVEKLLNRILAGKEKPIELTRLRVTLDGVELSVPVLNEVFISHRSPAGTTRYLMEFTDKEGQAFTVLQKSSGLIVASPAGTTGLNRSAKGTLMKTSARGFKYHNLAAFMEPGKTYYEQGEVEADKSVVVHSEMMEGLVFIDGQHICHPFPRGAKVVIDTGAPRMKAFVDPNRHLAFQ